MDLLYLCSRNKKQNVEQIKTRKYGNRIISSRRMRRRSRRNEVLGWLLGSSRIRYRKFPKNLGKTIFKERL